jgi:recombination protein U
MRKNTGKLFEADFAASVPSGVYYQRLKDPAQSFGGGGVTRFSPTNPYDCFLYKHPNLFTLELKSVAKSTTFWKESFDMSVKKYDCNIKKHQILGLKKASENKGVIAGLVINFRDAERTYFVEINRFIEVANHMAKNSMNEIDVSSMGVLIPQQQKKVHWRYDIQHLIDEVGD